MAVPAWVPVATGEGLEFTVQCVSRFNWTISRDGFLCSITTKIHQMELRGFNVGNCGAKRSVIGLSNESGENAVGNEAGLALNSARVMAQTALQSQLVSPPPMPKPGPLHWTPCGGSGLCPCLCWGLGDAGTLLSCLVILVTSDLQIWEAHRPPCGGLFLSRLYVR